MGVYMKGAHLMPRNCNTCWFVNVCNATHETSLAAQTFGNKRHPDCPLIEVPAPHGRLIDADVLEPELWEEVELPSDTYDYGYVSQAQITLAPTIIEAED